MISTRSIHGNFCDSFHVQAVLSSYLLKSNTKSSVVAWLSCLRDSCFSVFELALEALGGRTPGQPSVRLLIGVAA